MRGRPIFALAFHSVGICDRKADFNGSGGGGNFSFTKQFNVTGAQGHATKFINK